MKRPKEENYFEYRGDQVIYDMGNAENYIETLEEYIDYLESVGKEATSLIAHLKDQYGFNDEEQKAQDKVMTAFKYEGDW